MRNLEQHELYEHARKRVKQKKRSYIHFVVFVIVSIFLTAINKLFDLGEPYDWYLWAILLWFFFIVLHFVNVFFTSKFMGKEWERKQTDKLILKQQMRIEKIEKNIAKESDIKNESEEYAKNIQEKKNDENNEIVL